VQDDATSKEDEAMSRQHPSVPEWIMLGGAILLGIAANANAGLGDLDPASARGKAATKCLRTMQKEAARYHWMLAKLAERCTKPVVQGKGGTIADCDPLPAPLDAKRLGARDRLRLKIERACGGGNGQCSAADTGADADVPLADVNWSAPLCPALHASACAGSPLADCGDVADCLACQIDASVAAALGDLVADRLDPTIFGATAEPARARNRCQQAVVKESRKFVAAKSKILQKCWDGKLKRAPGYDDASPCPGADASGRAGAQIAKLERKLAGRVCRLCGGGGDADGDGHCDVNPSDLGFLAAGFACPGVATVPASATHRYPRACGTIGSGPGAEVANLQEYVDCVTCALEAGADCLGSLAHGDDAALALDYPLECMRVVPPTCGNGALDAGEDCDASAPAPDDACPSDTPCSPTCTCACPARFELVADASDPDSRIDAGWTGFVHEGLFLSDAKVTLAVTSCDDGDGADLARDPRCGVCTLAGPVPNAAAGAGDVPNRRCTGDPSLACATDLDCAGSGACAFFVGAPLPFTLPSGGCACSVGGCVCSQSLGSCVLTHFAEPLTGTIDVESGEMALAATVTSRVVYPVDLDAPCPICAGDATPNDGTPDGTCTAGPRSGQPCDAHGTSPIGPFGATSFDCPVDPSTLAGAEAHTSRLVLATAGRTATITAASPGCTATGYSALRCACDTCSDGAATPCASDADCAPGDTCGGLRCLGGPNHGDVCTLRGLSDPACAGAPCGTVGTPTQPSSCLDTVCTPIGGGRGQCAAGPWDLVCGPVETYRYCGADSDCPVAGDICQARARACFLDNGVIGGTIDAEGTPDVPMGDVASPILAGVTCPSSPVGYGAGVMGLPGPMRVTLRSLVSGIQGP
jgi:hypothetical protein